MKKILVFAVAMLMSITANAISFGFAGVDKVAQSGDKFYAYTAGGVSVEITAWQFKQMSEAEGYYILSVGDKKIVAAGDEFSVESLVVEDVVPATDGEKVKVLFTSGQKLFKNPEWLKALKGQQVRRIYINTPTWEFENFSTLDEGQVVMLHNKVAPTKKTTAVAPAAPEAPAADKQTDAQGNNNAPKTIKFSITH